MRKSKNGYVMLALLVITGLAGTIYPGSITSKERKVAATAFKETKVALLQSVKDLSQDQLSFKQAADRWSVEECVFHLALAEMKTWQVLENALKQPTNPEKRAEIKLTDEELINRMKDRSHKVTTSEKLEPKNSQWKTAEEALEYFKHLRAEHIKYIKTTTEDLRNHVVQMPYGWVDCYQLCLVMAAHTDRHTQQLNEVKGDPNFPTK